MSERGIMTSDSQVTTDSSQPVLKQTVESFYGQFFTSIWPFIQSNSEDAVVKSPIFFLGSITRHNQRAFKGHTDRYKTGTVSVGVISSGSLRHGVYELSQGSAKFCMGGHIQKS